MRHSLLKTGFNPIPNEKERRSQMHPRHLSFIFFFFFSFILTSNKWASKQPANLSTQVNLSQSDCQSLHFTWAPAYIHLHPLLIYICCFSNWVVKKKINAYDASVQVKRSRTHSGVRLCLHLVHLFRVRRKSYTGLQWRVFQVHDTHLSSELMKCRYNKFKCSKCSRSAR